MVEKTTQSAASPAQNSGKWNVPTGRRTDEWSQALVSVGESQDRAAFTRFFQAFCPADQSFRAIGLELICDPRRRTRARGDAEGLAEGGWV